MNNDIRERHDNEMERIQDTLKTLEPATEEYMKAMRVYMIMAKLANEDDKDDKNFQIERIKVDTKTDEYASNEKIEQMRIESAERIEQIKEETAKIIERMRIESAEKIEQIRKEIEAEKGVVEDKAQRKGHIVGLIIAGITSITSLVIYLKGYGVNNDMLKEVLDFERDGYAITSQALKQVQKLPAFRS